MRIIEVKWLGGTWSIKGTWFHLNTSRDFSNSLRVREYDEDEFCAVATKWNVKLSCATSSRPPVWTGSWCQSYCLMTVLKLPSKGSTGVYMVVFEYIDNLETMV